MDPQIRMNFDLEEIAHDYPGVGRMIAEHIYLKGIATAYASNGKEMPIKLQMRLEELEVSAKKRSY